MDHLHASRPESHLNGALEDGSLSEEAVSVEVLHAEHRAGDVAALQQVLPPLRILHAPRHVHCAIDGPGC